MDIMTYIYKNFILVCLAIVLYVNSILRYKQHRRISQCVIAITTIALYLSIGNALQDYTKSIGNVAGTTILSYIGYTVRPVCLVLLIVMSGQFIIRRKYEWIVFIPLAINAIIYLFAFFPATKTAVYFFHTNDDGTLSFSGGPLRYTSHLVSLLYLAFLVYISISKLKGKHFSNGLSIMLFSVFIVLSVVIESFFPGENNVDYLLNTMIVAGTVVYYLFLYHESAQIDVLTGLFNRETYYHDLAKMKKSITGVVQLDMNGLKYINDNFGHIEGDKALSTIAQIIINNATSKMYAYRLGGDEYTILALNASKGSLEKFASKVKEDLSKTEYHCSIGYAHQMNRDISIEDLLKEAEEKMYLDKAEFYKTSAIDRRKY